MKILALIPARGDSKRLKNKNILDLGGKPLINWSIEQAVAIENIVDVLVSTDSKKIAEVSKKAGAIVPWLRPKNLATDNASSVDVAIHALDWYESQVCTIDGLLLLQPTSPFRSKVTIQKAIDMFESSKYKSIIGVSPGLGDLNKSFFYENSIMYPVSNLLYIPPEHEGGSNFYTVNGCIYLISPEQLRSNETFFSPDFIPLKVDSPIESIDIDTEWDFSLAQSMIEFLK